MLTLPSETLTFSAADAAATYLSLIETAKGDVPWWAIGDRRDCTPACVSDATPLRGAERAIVAAAILASPTGSHLGRWWQESRMALAPSAAIEVRTPGFRWLRPCEPAVDDVARDAACTVDYVSIIDRLLAAIAISDGDPRFPFSTGERSTAAICATMPPRRMDAELAALVERMALAYVRKDRGMLSGDVLAHNLASGLTAAFALSSLGVDPCVARIDDVVLPAYDLAHIAAFAADRQVALLIDAADVAERMAERILEPVRPNVYDIMAERPSTPAPSRITVDPDASDRDSRTLAQVVAQAQRVARLLDHGNINAS